MINNLFSKEMNISVHRFDNITIKYSHLRYLLLLFPFIPIYVLDVGRLYDIALASIFVFSIVIILKGEVKLKKHNLFLLGYVLVLVFSTIMNRTSIISSIFYGAKIFSFSVIIDYFMQKGKVEFLKVARNYVIGLTLINTFFQYIKQDAFGIVEKSGNYNNFAFGDNDLGYYYVPLIAVCLVIDFLNEKKVSALTTVISLVCFLSIIRAWSAKAVVGIGLVLIYIIFLYQKKISKILNYYVVVLSYLFLSVGITFFGVQEKMSFFMETVLKKDATLTGRTYLWNMAKEVFSNSYIYGYGVEPGGYIRLVMTRAGAITSSHNIILELLLQTGIVGTLLFAGFIFCCLYNKEKKNNEYFLTLMLLFFSLIILIMQLTSGKIYLAFSYIPFTLCANAEYIYAYRRTRI